MGSFWLIFPHCSPVKDWVTVCWRATWWELVSTAFDCGPWLYDDIKMFWTVWSLNGVIKFKQTQSASSLVFSSGHILTWLSENLCYNLRRILLSLQVLGSPGSTVGDKTWMNDWMTSLPSIYKHPLKKTLTLLPQIRSSISSGLNRYLSGDSLVTMWKPLLNALNCFSTLLFRMYSEYCATNSYMNTHQWEHLTNILKDTLSSEGQPALKTMLSLPQFVHYMFVLLLTFPFSSKTNHQQLETTRSTVL